MTNARIPRYIPALFLALLLAACGSPGDYQKPIQTFAEATTSARDSLRQYVVALDRQAEEALMEKAVKEHDNVEVPEGECAGISASPCHVVYKAGAKSISLSPEFSAPNLLALFDAIKTYADGLQAIATSDSASKAEASLASTSGNLKALAELIDKQGTASAYAEPVASGAAWLIGEYIDQIRLDALRSATQEADPLVAEAASYFEDTLQIAVDGTRGPFSFAVIEKESAFSDDPSPSTIKSLVKAVDDYNAALSAEPKNVFDKFKSSHHELTEALKRKELSFANAFAAMESLKAEAEKLKKIVEAFIAASQKE